MARQGDALGRQIRVLQHKLPPRDPVGWCWHGEPPRFGIQWRYKLDRDLQEDVVEALITPVTELLHGGLLTPVTKKSTISPQRETFCKGWIERYERE